MRAAVPTMGPPILERERRTAYVLVAGEKPRLLQSFQHEQRGLDTHDRVGVVPAVLGNRQVADGDDFRGVGRVDGGKQGA